MKIGPTRTKRQSAFLARGTILACVVGALMLGGWPAGPTTSRANGRAEMEEEIWKLEEAYFTHLYKANYEAVLALVHPQFLGWPGQLPKPITQEESARFMRQMIPRPTTCSIRIERGGLQITDHTALTQYTLYVTNPESSESSRTRVSRITHTWVLQDGQWKLLGGMSFDLKKE